MERTLYFNYTKPSQTQLNNTEDSKVRSIIRRQRSSAQMGIRTGFRVSVNALDSTTIDIGPGEGYTGGYFENKNLRSVNAGERVSTLTPAITGAGYTPTAEAVSLIDYTDGTKNYVSLLYAESLSDKLAENRYPAYAEHDTIVSETYTVEVLAEADWLLLSDDDLENRILVAIVTAKGAGVGLSSADIDQLVQPNNHPYTSGLTTLSAITVEIISDETTIGTGIVRWDPATSMIYWTAPGDSEGAGTSVTSNGTYYVYSATTQFFIKIIVIFASLPVAATSESLIIKALYGRQIPLYCSIDQAHRDMVGTGAATPTNPHGLSIDDISGGTFEHADLFHKNGITCHADRAQLEPSIDLANDRVAVKNLGLKDNSFLIDGTTYQLINGVAALNDGYVNFNALVTGDYLIYLDSAATLSYVSLSDVQFDDGVPTDFNGFIKLVNMHNETNGACSLEWNQDDRTLTFTGTDGGAGTPIPLQQAATGTYYKLYSGDPLNWIIVYVDGDMSTVADHTLNFNTAFGENIELDQSILKICVVSWNDVTELLTNIFDLRRFNTADNRVEVEEEHDEFGQHSKVIHNPFRVAGLNDTAVFASAATFGVYAEGGNPTNNGRGMGVFGLGQGSVAGFNVFGVAGVASNYDVDSLAIGVIGSVTGVNATGVVGNGNRGTGVYATGSVFGGYAIASNSAFVGTAGSNTAIYGQAVRNIAIFGTVSNVVDPFGASITGVYGRVSAKDAGVGNYAIGGKFEAVNTDTAASVIGVLGSAAHTGVYGLVATNTGVMGSAVDTGVLGKADTNGVWGSAKNYGVYGTAATAFAGYFAAGNTYGVYGAAANETGVFGTAATYGICGSVGVSIGMYGLAPTTGIYGIASANSNAVITGIIGYAVNPGTAGNVVGIKGSAGLVGTGAMGYAHTAMYGVGTCSGNYDAYGLYAVGVNDATASRAYGVFGSVGGAGATGIYGAHGASGRAIAGVAGVAGGIGIYGAGSAYGGYFLGSHTGAYCTAASVGIAGLGVTGGYFNANTGIHITAASTAIDIAFSAATGIRMITDLGSNKPAFAFESLVDAPTNAATDWILVSFSRDGALRAGYIPVGYSIPA